MRQTLSDRGGNTDPDRGSATSRKIVAKAQYIPNTNMKTLAVQIPDNKLNSKNRYVLKGVR